MTVKTVTRAETPPSHARGRNVTRSRALPSPLPGPENPVLLIVDDDASVRQSLGRVLAGSGYRVLTASDGTEALGIFNRERIDLALLDIGLPSQSGWETFERFTGADPFLPIIVITGTSGRIEIARNARVAAWMEKPLDVTALLETVPRLLSEAEEARSSGLCGSGGDVPPLSSASPTVGQKVRESSGAPYHCSNAGQTGGG